MQGQIAKELKVDIDTSIYPLEAVQMAAYALTDRVYARIARRNGKSVSVSLTPKSAAAQPDLAHEFHNELLHDTLRLKVSKANQKIREYVVTKALLSAQVPSTALPEASVQEECPECAAEAKSQPMDKDLEKEIDKLMADIEKSGSAEADPLGVAIPWEKKYGAEADKKSATRSRVGRRKKTTA
jgi:His-Xaa-Ser system protein HxsD